MSVPNCLICCSNVKTTKVTSRVNDEDSPETPDDDIIAKLRYIAPEVEWCEEYYICEQCLGDLLTACKFKERCLKRNISSSDLSFDIKEGENCVLKDVESESDENPLISHVQKCDMTASPKTEFQCNNCYRYYKTPQLLKRHISTKCSMQTTDDQNDTELEERSDCQRTKKCNRFKNFTCQKCDEKFNMLRKFVEHSMQVHSMNRTSIKPYSCETCNARFKTSSSLLSHRSYHDGNRTKICSYCGKSFITKSDLLAHELIHFDARPFKCDLCAKTFKTNANLHTHKLNVHTDPSKWKHVCNVCGKRFSQKTNHDQHIKRHLGEKNFACPICSKGFITKSEMKEHEGHHLNLMNFRCEHCGQAYRKRYNYKVHLSKVHGIGNAKLSVLEKKYECHICPAKFVEKRRLSGHLCKHSGLKPYPCTVCGKKFNNSSYLKVHMRVKHREIGNECEVGD